MSNNVEIEVKVLLGEKINAENLVQKLYANDPATHIHEESKQLNHYFLITWAFAKIKEQLQSSLSPEQTEKLDLIIQHGTKHSLRTRKANEKLILVIKASADESTSANGVARLEREAEIPNMTIDQLDQILLEAGFTYQSKWSRERVEYIYKDFHVCLDKNAGYGYLTEVELVIQDKAEIDTAKEKIRKELDLLGLQELDQNRLERMFAFYNQHWPEYYGTEKTFIIE